MNEYYMYIIWMKNIIIIHNVYIWIEWILLLYVYNIIWMKDIYILIQSLPIIPLFINSNIYINRPIIIII